jgi:xanthine dehydrogenase accessory factor
VAPAPRVVLVGAVDTAEAVCRLARVLGWRTAVIDPRARFATPERLPSADEVVIAWPEDAYRALALEPADAVVVLTHDPKVDDPALIGALAAGAAYVGALGSRRTQAERRERLLAAGAPAADVARIRGPVGLDIGALGPAETALSIVAEIVADRSGRAGLPLAATSGPIHHGTETSATAR